MTTQVAKASELAERVPTELRHMHRGGARPWMDPSDRDVASIGAEVKSPLNDVLPLHLFRLFAHD
jgi:hypothetical protein